MFRTIITKRKEPTGICLKKISHNPFENLEEKQDKTERFHSKIKKHTNKASPYIPRGV